MSLHDHITPTIVRDPSSGLPIIASVGEVQMRAMLERGQAVVQDLQAKVDAQAAVINKIRAAFGVLCLEAEDELIEFEPSEFRKIEGRALIDEIVDTPDGRKLWRIYLEGPKAEAARKRDARSLRVVEGGTA